MNWTNLLAGGRLGCPPSPSDEQLRRSEAQRDFDRVVFSRAFRRLQGKTQVFPLPESDMTHTRLTHSLEAACVGRSLGWIAAEKLPDLKPYQAEVAATVMAAALAHDLGNPPFGHSGERAIGDYFLHGPGRRYLEGLSELQEKELLSFEGNALGLRLLTRQKPVLTTNPGGLGLTYVTLGAFAKYPCTADKVDKSSGIHRKKFGIFHDDLDGFAEVANALGLAGSQPTWARHPLAFLTEAADDICYRIIDLEDGYRLRLVPYGTAHELLKGIAEATTADLPGLQKIRAEDQRIGYLRAKAINGLIDQAVSAFVSSEQALLDGTRHEPLLVNAEPKDLIKKLEQISRDQIYAHRPVVEIEAAGFEVLGVLLDAFLSAAFESSARDQKCRKLIPTQYLPYEDAGLPRATQILSICEFVASMTDEYAISMYRTLKGISLPRP